MGESTGLNQGLAFMSIDGKASGYFNQNVLGTYVHGIFDNTNFTQGILNNIRRKRGLQNVNNIETHDDLRNRELNILADTVMDNIDMKALYSIINGEISVKP